MSSATVVRTITVVAAVFLVLVGIWAFFAPRAFYDSLATWPPFNKHFIHDIGAFQMGIGASLLAALAWSDALLVALFGAAVGSVFHTIAHVIDRDLGGKTSDPYLLGVLAVVLIVATVLRKREVPA